MDNLTPSLKKIIDNENRLDYKNYDLEGMKKILALLNHPEKNFPSIHIAGTNGKGSVAHLLNKIFSISGYKTGLYTSPHLIDYRERIKIKNRLISLTKLNLYLKKITDLSQKNNLTSLTFFDLSTALAFKYFSDQKIDIAIIETGLGGKSDSTNLIEPLVSIITPISIDHTTLLGENLGQITTEKAGIIKNKNIVITSNKEPSILKTIQKKVLKFKGQILVPEIDFKSKNIKSNRSKTSFDYELKTGSGKKRIKNLTIKQPGNFQVANSLLAITTALLLKKRFPLLSLKHLKKALSSWKIPGRLETLSHRPKIIFDLAHNYEACLESLKFISHNYPQNKTYLIFSILKDKDYRSIINLLVASKIPILYLELEDKRALKISGSKYEKFFLKIIKQPKSLKKELLKISSRDSTLVFIGTARNYKIAKEVAAEIKIN